MSAGYRRLFGGLDPCGADAADLARLAASMIERYNTNPRYAAAPTNLHAMPAGYTYLGQFVDHDLTFEVESRLGEAAPVDQLRNARSPRFDLDSVYGGGPIVDPHLYGDDGAFRIDRRCGAVPAPGGVRNIEFEDLPRAGPLAVIADPRNDENQLIGQLHLAFLKFHNRVLREVGSFAAARQIVCWHYQFMVLTSFLPKLLGVDRVNAILQFEPRLSSGAAGVLPGGRWRAVTPHFNWAEDARIPVEFSAAAYRFGHSLVRNMYALQAGTEIPALFTRFKDGVPIQDDLRGRRPLSANHVLQWFRFLALPSTAAERAPGETAHHALQPARAIDSLMAEALVNLPVPPAAERQADERAAAIPSLALRNLLRGEAMQLPSGQAVAKAMGLTAPAVLRADNVAAPFTVERQYRDESVPRLAKSEAQHLDDLFSDATPLWYYVLKEAEVICAGQQLGPVGGAIVGEVFGGLLAADADAFLNSAPNWRPTPGRFGAESADVYNLENLVAFASG